MAVWYDRIELATLQIERQSLNFFFCFSGFKILFAIERQVQNHWLLIKILPFLSERV